MPIRLRTAGLSDGKMLFDWRNDPDTRAASHNTDELNLNDHMRWFKGTLENPKRKLLIAEKGTEPVGTVRIDLDDTGNSAELSWTVAPSARGKGIGKQMVAEVAATEPWCSLSLRAEVKEGNIPSKQIAEAAGMHFIRSEDGVMHFENTI